ncbi:MAG: VOC family protein [Bdellovibrionota bacterium]|nr:VOC family protein [Bdellovibrionota bacterium]
MKLSYVILYVKNIKKSVHFYEEAFGLKHRFTHESGDYAEMDTGSTCLAFCAYALADMTLKTSQKRPDKNSIPMNSQISFEPENVKDAYEKAINAGAISIYPPEIKPWNFEVAMLRDGDGHIIELAKNLNP